jgi:pimeloyl-ACP methyl ester carboxylesterase
VSPSSSLFGAALFFSLIASSSPAAADLRTDQIVSSLGSAARVADVVSTSEWTWTKVDLADEAVPLRIDILVTNGADDRRALFMFPGAGIDFDSNFFTPRDKNIAHFMRERGYIVIGINSRADSLSPTASDPFLAGWGLAKLRDDAHAVITKLRPVIGRHFDLLGHSLGGVEALDYAARYPDDLESLFLIDTLGPYDPVAEHTFVSNSEASSEAYATLLGQGIVTFDNTHSLGQLLAAAAAFPTADSGVPRTPFPGDFTLLGLVYFSLIHTGELPGIITPLTGLPQNWFAAEGAAGTYTFDADPQLDAFSLTQTPFSVLLQALAGSGSGIVPTAQFRDVFAICSDNGDYVVPFADIRAKVSWVNTSLGLGNHPYASRLITAGGNPSVRYSVVDGYGHLDPVYGVNASRDFWSVLVGEDEQD